MFADGTGRASDFNAWVAELPLHLSNPYTSGEGCAVAWGACKQQDRRDSIATALASARRSLHWLEGIWHARWCNIARREVEPAPALLTLEAPFDSAAAAARSRVLHGAAASWPDGGKLAMLRLWPSSRVALGVRLQTAISLGASKPEVAALFPPLWRRAHRRWAAEGLDTSLSEPVLGAPWLPIFAILEVGSIAGRASPRAALAHGRLPARNPGSATATSSVRMPLLALFQAACRASFAPVDARARKAVAHACDAHGGDPLWPALARHVARISTPDDRALLEDLARHPEKREPPLSWGLQHYVRGDLVLDDDSVVTLDELCAQHGLAPLPLLEDMPDELDLPVDDAPA